MNASLSEAVQSGLKLYIENNYENPLIGFEFSSNTGYGVNTVCIAVRVSELSPIGLEKLIKKEFSYRSYSFSEAVMLEGEEWEIGDYSFTIFNTWGKIIKVIKEKKITKDGKYVIVNHCANTFTEVDMYNTHRWIKDSELSIDVEHEVLFDKIGICRKASDLEIIYIPEHHMWSGDNFETYPDDPGCGIYSSRIKVADKATGVLIDS
jgi:hypothetical protein